MTKVAAQIEEAYEFEFVFTDNHSTDRTFELLHQLALSDPRVRAAVERHAVIRATAYFTELGYRVEDVGSTRSYDLHVTDEIEERR